MSLAFHFLPRNEKPILSVFCLIHFYKKNVEVKKNRSQKNGQNIRPLKSVCFSSWKASLI